MKQSLTQLNTQTGEAVIDVGGLYGREIEVVRELVELLKKQHNAKQFIVEDKKEKAGWLALAEKNINKIWDNPTDEKIWNKYLKT